MPTVKITLPEVHQEIISDNHRYKVIDAGRGFAKSGILLAEAVKDLCTAYYHPTGQRAGSRIIYSAPTYTEGRDIIWDRAREFLEPFTAGRPNSSRLEIPLVNGGLFVIKGSQNPDSLRGPYCTKFLGDEFAFHKEGYLMKIVRPMLGKVRPFGSVVLASTPDGLDEFYELWQRGQDPEDLEWKSWQYSSLDGGFMDPQEVEDGRKDMTLAQWKQEYYGIFMASSDTVYNEFDPAQHLKRITPRPDKYAIEMSLDFNSAHGTHMNLSHVLGEKTYYFDEICYGPSNDCLDEFIRRYPPGTVRAINLYGDYSGMHGAEGHTEYQHIQSRLYKEGYQFPEIRVYGGNPLIRSRVHNTNRLFRSAGEDIRIFADKDNCPTLINDWKKVKWAKHGGGKLDKVTDPTLTHSSDGADYQHWVMFPPKWSTKPEIKRRDSGIEVVNSSGYWVDKKRA